MSDDLSHDMRSGLFILCEAAKMPGGWQTGHAEEFIRVGEYALALESIAYAYLNSNSPMPVDQFEIFNGLATAMELEKAKEYGGVARMRKNAMRKLC